MSTLAPWMALMNLPTSPFMTRIIILLWCLVTSHQCVCGVWWITCLHYMKGHYIFFIEIMWCSPIMWCSDENKLYFDSVSRFKWREHIQNDDYFIIIIVILVVKALCIRVFFDFQYYIQYPVCSNVQYNVCCQLSTIKCNNTCKNVNATTQFYTPRIQHT